MEIVKIFNNNVVLAKDDSGNEIVAMGRGLAYLSKVKDHLDPQLIDKTFVVQKQDTQRYLQLLETLPSDIMLLTEDTIAKAEERLNRKLSHTIHFTLSDHLNTMIERGKLNNYLKNMMLWDISHLYQDEFLLAQELVARFNQMYSTLFDDHEAASISLHFVNASIDGDFSTTMRVTKIIADILNIVKYYFRIEYDEKSFSYHRFVVHLRFFSQRIFGGEQVHGIDDDHLTEYVHTRYRDAYQCAKQIQAFIRDSYHYEINEDECVYLTVHIVKVVGDSMKL